MASGAMLVAISGLSPAMADCNANSKHVAKYLAIYNQNSEDVGDSWRYYIRPRKGACLTQKGTNIVGTSAVPYMVIHPGSKNCSAKYKSYVTIPVPKPTTQSGTPVLTTLYVTIGNTKAHATSDGPGGYGTEINFQPFTRADGTPGMNVVAVCFR
jgi:hypothetical protein